MTAPGFLVTFRPCEHVQHLRSAPAVGMWLSCWAGPRPGCQTQREVRTVEPCPGCQDCPGWAERPVLFDLFCCQGGAGMGYHQAGFRVIGVDREPQPRYPFEFIQADAMQVLEYIADGAEPWPGAPRPDAIHASPPCQTFARVTAWRGSRDNHPNLLEPALKILSGLSIPWVVENVPEAGLRADFRLCGTQFGLPVRRHRDFQCGNWSAYDLLPSCQCYKNPRLLPFEHKGERAFADAMGCTWMSNDGGRQAVPPAFTEFIGGFLMEHLSRREAA